MKKIILIGLLFSIISCSNIDSYLKDKNYITFNDNVKYKVIENKSEKEKIIEKKRESQEKQTINNKSDKVIVEIPKKIDDKKKEDIHKEIIENKVEKEKIEKKKESQEKQVINNKSDKVIVEIPKKIDDNKKEKINDIVNSESINMENKVNNVTEEKKSIQLINKLTKRVSSSSVNFTSEDEKIIQYISSIVVENESQIKDKTLDSINRLKQKGINLTTKEFLALAYKNIKDTRVNSYILAVARVMNNVERGKK